MRKVVVGAFVSLDGVMQAPGGPEEDPSGGFKFGGWVAPTANTDPVFGAEISKLFDQPFDLLLGRRTYDIFAAHWPYAEGWPVRRHRQDFQPHQEVRGHTQGRGPQLEWFGQAE